MKIETVEMFDGSIVHLARAADGDRCWLIEGTIRFKNEAIARAAFEQLVEVLNMSGIWCTARFRPPLETANKSC